MPSKQKLLNIDANAKTVKGQAQGYLTGILYLAPANLSGFNVCPTASAGCKAACLNTAGRGAFNSTQAARIKKTLFYFNERENFMVQLWQEIGALVRKATRDGLTPCVRLNGTSDIVWERVPVILRPGMASGLCSMMKYENIMRAFPTVQFYDYTKRANRRDLPDNYHLTFSLAEDNERQAATVLKRGENVAIVFRTTDYPKQYNIARGDGTGAAGRVIDGAAHDLRFLDARGVIVGLCAKGKARYDTTGFVRD